MKEQQKLIGQKRVWTINQNLLPSYKHAVFVIVEIDSNGQAKYDYIHELKLKAPIKVELSYILKRSQVLPPSNGTGLLNGTVDYKQLYDVNTWRTSVKDVQINSTIIPPVIRLLIDEQQ